MHCVPSVSSNNNNNNNNNKGKAISITGREGP
jgi:hypothetical protein